MELEGTMQVNLGDINRPLNGTHPLCVCVCMRGREGGREVVLIIGSLLIAMETVMGLVGIASLLTPGCQWQEVGVFWDWRKNPRHRPHSLIASSSGLCDEVISRSSSTC